MKRAVDEAGNIPKRTKYDPVHDKAQERFNRNQSDQKCQWLSANANSKQLPPSKNYRTLPVQPLSTYDRNFPYFRKPNEIGHFSQDLERKFKDNGSQLKIYCPPLNKNQVSYNLREGYHTYDKRDESIRENLDDLLRWICCHKEKFAVQNNQTVGLSTDFVCWRGLLTKLLCTPYENREGWLIAVTLYNNTYYMCEFDTEEKILQKQNDTERQKEMTYWGVKFEQFVTAEPSVGKPKTDCPVNNKEAFGSVVRTRLDKHSIVYGGEIDCYESENGQKKYIELKTSREIDHQRQLNNFKRFKAIKWWAQSFLIGIEKIVCGFRDDNGVIHRLEDFATKALPKYCQDIPNCWQPNICFNFLDAFFNFVKERVKIEDTRMVHLFRWNPKGNVECTSHIRDREYCFLPKWYIDKLDTLQCGTSTTTEQEDGSKT